MRHGHLAGEHPAGPRAAGLRWVLALAFAAVIAGVGAVEGPLMWMLTIPLVVVTVAVGVLYQRTLEWEAGDPRPGYLGFFLLIPSVGAISVRGTEAVIFASPLLALAGGVLAWGGIAVV